MLPAGEVVEIVGEPSSGRTSLLVSWLRAVTGRGATAALVDADGVFDPASAAASGVDLGRLLWLRCGGRRAVALQAAELLARCPGFALVALDLGELAPRLPLPRAFRWRLTVRRTGVTLVIVSRRRLAGPGADLALRTVRRELAWTGPGPVATRLARLATAVEVLRRRGAAAAGPSVWWWEA